MRIHEALNRAAENVRLSARRSCWGRGVNLVINKGRDDTHLLIFSEDGGSVRVPWAATTDDICADDWEVV